MVELDLKKQIEKKELELNALLEITQAINSNVSEESLYKIFNFTLRSNLNISKLGLFAFDNLWACKFHFGTKKNFWVAKGDLQHAREWYGAGFTNAMKTPDDTLVFVTPEDEKIIRKDQADCMGCLSQCAFSSWAENEKNSTGRLADPRSFCIQKTLQDIAHGGPVEQNLMFAGHAAFRFKQDPFYSNGFVPTVKQLVDRILTGA